MKINWSWLLAGFFLLGILVACDKDEDPEEQRIINMKNKEAGELFLLQNRELEGVNETFSGLQYLIHTKGSGIRPFDEDSASITYVGRLIDGTEFTSQTEEVLLTKQIEGFSEGLKLMHEGSTCTLYIPYYLAYNAQSKTVSYNDETVVIQPYSVLIFDVTLNKVIRN